MEKQIINPDAFAITEGGKYISLQRVLNVVCEVLNVNPLEVQSKTQKQRIVKARHYFFYLAYRTRKQHTLEDIGDFVGRDYSTVIAGRDKISGYMDVYQDVLDLVMEMRSKLTMEKGDIPVKRVNPNEQMSINKLHVGYYDTPEKLEQLKNNNLIA